MKVTSKERASSYSIKGLTEDEMLFLRDLMGRFADNPGDGGIKRHFHTHLMCAIDDALGLSLSYEPRYRIEGHVITYDNSIVLHSRYSTEACK